MSSFREVLNEELKDPAVRFWWYFYGPIYMWRTVKSGSRPEYDGRSVAGKGGKSELLHIGSALEGEKL